MLSGTVYFYNDFNRVLLEMDSEDFDELTNKVLFQKILDLDATKVVLKGVSHNHQNEASEAIIFSRRYK